MDSSHWQEFCTYHFLGFVFHFLLYVLAWMQSHWAKVIEEW